jgi:hypothetical protein
MNGSHRRMGNIKRQSVAGIGLCASGLALMAWPLVNHFLGAAHGSMLLFVAMPVLIGCGLITSGFALMVAGAEPFEDDGGGVRELDDRE